MCLGINFHYFNCKNECLKDIWFCKCRLECKRTFYEPIIGDFAKSITRYRFLLFAKYLLLFFDFFDNDVD